MMNETNQSQHLFAKVFKQILRPMIRFALARQVPFQVVSDLLKDIYVSVCKDEFTIPGKRLTDSRISVLTGLQRKDIKAIRSFETEAEPIDQGGGILARIVAHWISSDGFQDKKGKPLPLPKAGPAPSFEALVSLISKDTHPRTLLDELLIREVVTLEDDKIQLTENALVPRHSKDEETLMNYLANNLGDHADAAVSNVLSDSQKAPFYERAVHYNQLSISSIEELESLSRKLQQEALEKVNAQALELQKKDKESKVPKGRFRYGAYIFSTKPDDDKSEESKS